MKTVYIDTGGRDCGWLVETFGPGSKDPGFECQSYFITSSPYVHQCSSTGLSNTEWCVVC
jgi:hypothetical protein